MSYAESRLRVTRYKNADMGKVLSTDMRETLKYLQEEFDANWSATNYFGLEHDDGGLCFSWVEYETEEEYKARTERDENSIKALRRIEKRQEINREIERLKKELENV